MNPSLILAELKSYANPANVAGMARFGITGKHVLGGPNIPTIRKMAKKIGKNHKVALELWISGIHEARILAPMIDEFELVTEKQFLAWASDFDSWDVCDQCCTNLFDKVPFAYEMVVKLSGHKEEFVKRTSFALMAVLAVHDKKASDKKMAAFFPIIKRECKDERNYVKKAVNWALRQIGKRNADLRKQAIKVAEEISKIDNKAAKWIAGDALRELKKIKN
ncbi:MAG: hypothetical protein US89_C0005G0067 [Candidatus Peregrinibacteria bacterium GW2011_GWF2_38_29]|nr:MAG: hypothetical protein US89_C0005G0067 [Candidatus Peregrinibacteria bacterium GW2011_GWF2_38_29]HBB02654.1 DNA alkylation repair protein [Candidatus Peregrinibacteria bacterium]